MINKFKKKTIFKSLYLLNDGIGYEQSNVVPRIIFQTFKNELTDDFLIDNVSRLKMLNPDFEYKFYDDNDIVDFLKKYFNPLVLECFNKLKPGAFKADLFRYCILYIFGGVYLDIKAIPLISFDKIINENDNDLYLTKERNVYGKKGYTDWGNQGYIYNGFIISKPGNNILKECIIRCINNIIINNYSHCFLCITGPGVFKDLDTKNYVCFELEPSGKYITYDNKNIIDLECPGYRNKYCSTFKQTYSGMWVCRDVFK